MLVTVILRSFASTPIASNSVTSAVEAEQPSRDLEDRIVTSGRAQRRMAA